MLLEGRNGIVFGVGNKRSIGYACAKAFSREGASLIITYQRERLEERVRALTATLPGETLALQCDVSRDEPLDQAFETIAGHMPKVDFVVHSIAFAPRDDLHGDFVDTSRDGFWTAMNISAYSFAAIARRAAPLMTEGGSIMTMTYLGGDKVVPSYNVMGPAKAALESSTRYLAQDLGPRNIRVNAISAGPIRTVAAHGISDFGKMLEISEKRSPLRRNISSAEVADTAVFLCSDLSRGVTGETIFVDAGFNITAL